jgi:hypothetical protein
MNEMDLTWFHNRRARGLLPLYGPRLTFTLNTPLISILFAQNLLDCTRPNIQRFREEGALRMFDISLNPRPGSHPTLRILTASILAIKNDDASLNPDSVEGALELILPRSIAYLYCGQVSKLFQTDSHFVYLHVEAKNLQYTEVGPRCGKERKISVASLRQFLLKRVCE